LGNAGVGTAACDQKNNTSSMADSSAATGRRTRSRSCGENAGGGRVSHRGCVVLLIARRGPDTGVAQIRSQTARRRSGRVRPRWRSRASGWSDSHPGKRLEVHAVSVKPGHLARFRQADYTCD